MSDRYQALGMPYPDPSTVCRGQCEGTGVYPLYREVLHGPVQIAAAYVRDVTADEHNAWMELHVARCLGWRSAVRRMGWAIRTGLEYAFAQRNEGIRDNNGGRWGAFVRGWDGEIRCGGTHFITCPTCGGTGKRAGVRSLIARLEI